MGGGDEKNIYFIKFLKLKFLEFFALLIFFFFKNRNKSRRRKKKSKIMMRELKRITQKKSILASSYASDGYLREQKMQPRDKFSKT